MRGENQPRVLRKRTIGRFGIEHVECEAGQTYLPNKADWLDGRWAGLKPAGKDVEDARRGATGVPIETLREIGEKITQVPEGFNLHKTIVLDWSDCKGKKPMKAIEYMRGNISWAKYMKTEMRAVADGGYDS